MAECTSCGQPTDGTICHREATKLANTLRTTADLWPELQLTIAKQTRHGDPHMLAAAYGYELGEQEERRRLAELLAAVDRALAKARREYVRVAERNGQDPGPEGECWAEFEALAHVARQHATGGDHHA